jgi:hypothetical protein
MKKSLLVLLLGILVGALAVWWLRPAGGSAEPVERKSDAAPATAERGALTLTAERIAAAGLTVASPTAVTLPAQVEAFGRVLDPAPLVVAATEVATAQATLTASEHELARVNALHEAGNNASAQAVETATAAAERDRAQSLSARARFAAAWGAALAARLREGFVFPALDQGWSFVRLDVPAEHPLLPTGATARVNLAANEQSTADAEILGPAPGTDAQFQGRSYFALIREPGWFAGSAVRAWVSVAGAPQSAWLLPRSAFVRHEGSVFVYVAKNPTQFERRRVELGPAQDAGLVVTSGLAAGDQVVTVGAGQLLSAELGGAGND